MFSIITLTLFDVMAQVLGWYDTDTSAYHLGYDFWAHALGGIFATIVLTNVLRMKNNKEAWVIGLSMLGGFLWEVIEFLIFLLQIKLKIL